MIYHFGECALDTQLYSVQRGGQSIRLRPKVFRMCLYLLEHRDRVVSRQELCGHLWPGRSVKPSTLEGVIRSLRQALGDSGRIQGIIVTRHSYGYRFVAEVEERLSALSEKVVLPTQGPRYGAALTGLEANAWVLARAGHWPGVIWPWLGKVLPVWVGLLLLSL